MVKIEFFNRVNSGLFLLIFRPFLIPNTITLSISSIRIKVSIDGLFGIRTQGRRTVVADETLELWRPPPTLHLICIVTFRKRKISQYSSPTWCNGGDPIFYHFYFLWSANYPANPVLIARSNFIKSRLGVKGIRPKALDLYALILLAKLSRYVFLFLPFSVSFDDLCWCFALLEPS